MSLPVTVENEALRAEIYPQFGGKVLSLIDKADDFELLFDYPSEFPTTCQYDRPYSNGYCAGWDECFPAVAPGIYPSHPYKGVPIPDHGELWSLPGSVVPSKDGVTTEWNGLRFGYRFTRRIVLQGSTLRAEYSLRNGAPFDFHFVWSMHALSSLHVPVQFQMPAGGYRLSHDEEKRRIDAPFDWPVTAAGHDLSSPVLLPPKRGWKIFSNEPIAAPVVVQYPSRGRKLTVEFASEDGLRAYWGLWVNSGFGGYRHFAVEPITGRYDELDRSVQDGSAGNVPPSGKVSWAVQWSVGTV